MTTLYHYDENTFEFLGESLATPDPLEPGHPPLVPAHATLLAPPSVRDKQVAVFDVETGKWNMLIDLRGEIYYRKPKYQAERQTVLGPLPEGAVTKIPLAVLKAWKASEARSQLCSAISTAITVESVNYAVDTFQVTLLHATLDAFVKGSLTGKIAWVLADGAVSTVTQETLIAVCDAYAVRAQAAIKHYNKLLVSITAATDEAMLNAIDMLAGWPA